MSIVWFSKLSNYLYFFGYTIWGDKMKKKYWYIIISLIVIGIGFFVFGYNQFQSNNSKSKYTTEKTETKINAISANTSSNTIINDNKQNSTPIETEIASFSTKIVTKDSSRQNNISITCSTLNDTLIENGQTFSFCNTVGQATTAKGYQKADIFDAKRK